MSKIFTKILDTCMGCPKRISKNGYHVCMGDDWSDERNIEAIDSNPTGNPYLGIVPMNKPAIPDWCPLEDYPVKFESIK